ncbi:cramped protein [Holotrichia oblita]|uniref:Cramped protein n=1 Tax=Holotrichia oblita TaxID=644536 RepID=A0ACB9T9B7_HOLOL|nr:cramped protein [Holotrichia oblita]
MNNDLPNNCKIILQQNIPIEDLLGSVTTYNNVEGSDSKSLQLRTSARVFKKMKLDSANAAVATSTIQEKKDPQSTKDETKPELQTARKVCRPLWTQEDKNLFFEALNEFGKDFEAIHSYVSNKLKKKGVAETMIKTKEQMRHLYYRTWHKISKHLRFSDVGYSKRGGTKRPRQESNSEKTSPTNKVVTTDNNENCVSEELPASVSEVIDEAVNTLLALQQYQQQCHESAGSSDEKPEPTEIKPDVKDLEKKQHDIAKIRNGWTLVDCGTLSIGDLYLMFGSDSKLILEYNWDQDVIKKEEEPSGNKNQENIEPIDEFDCSTKADIKDSLIKHPNDLSVTLKRLLSVAKLHYRKNRIQCPCGHVCSDTSKHSSNKNKIVTKNLTVTTSKDKFYNNQEKPVSVQQHGEVLMFQSLNNDTHIRRLSPSILFRRPSSPNDILREQLDSIQRLKPRYCNRRGRRPRSKPVIVERKLPILANKVENGRQIVQMNIISQDNLTSTQRPIVPKIQFENLNQESNLPNKLNPQYGSASASSSASTIVTNITFNNEVIQTTTKTDQLTRTYVAVTSTEENGVEHSVYTTQANALDISDNATTLSRVGSPTSISNLLQMALESHGAGNVMQTSEVKEDGSINFVGLLSQNMSTGNTPPTSPSRILKENENQWLNSEVADFSLSSFLGHLDSPMKTAQGNTAIAGDDNTRLSLAQDVDAHLQSLLTETSLDYTAKFADLAAQVTDIKK